MGMVGKRGCGRGTVRKTDETGIREIGIVRMGKVKGSEPRQIYALSSIICATIASWLDDFRLY